MSIEWERGQTKLIAVVMSPRAVLTVFKIATGDPNRSWVGQVSSGGNTESIRLASESAAVQWCESKVQQLGKGA